MFNQQSSFMYKSKLTRLGLLCLFLFTAIVAKADFRDIKVDLTNGGLLTSEEQSAQSSVTLGVAVAADGSVSRVAADAADANAVITCKFHSADHGMQNFSATVPVTGPVKITFGSCAWGSNVSVKNAAGTEVATMNTNIDKCYHGDKANNVVSCFYKGTDATTLTISGGSYVPYFAVEAADPADLKEEVNVTYSLGSVEAEGVVPAAEKVEVGANYTVPLNRTLYMAGKTLTAWTDGTNTYKPGETITAPSADVTLTPVFADNAKNLADRTAPVTLLFDFQRKNCAPLLAYQNKTGIYVTQAKVDDTTIDVKLDFDTNNGGKIANGNWQDWAQMNSGTKLTVPSAKGAVVTVEAYSAPTTTTIDGQTDYTANGNTITYTVGSKAETIDIVIGDGSYYRTFNIVLPVVVAEGGKTYTNEATKVVFAMNDGANIGANVAAPTDAFSTVAFDSGDCTINGTTTITNPDGSDTGITGIKFRPAGTTKDLNWFVRPAVGLTFTPTKVSGYVNRCGTDAGNGIVITAHKENGETVALGTYTAWRQGKSTSNKDYDKTAIAKFEITLTAAQQAKLAGTDGFYLTSAVGVGSAKDGAFGEVTIEGTVNGTIEAVNKYTVALVANSAEGGNVSIYPKSDEYIENDEVTITAEKAFGYKFINWTDKGGNVVSTEAKFKYTVTENQTLTANFEKVNTYALDIKVEGGANDYMVSLSPAATVVNGKNMYEEGTKVTITASSNPILTFTNWDNGETASEMPVVMNENKAFTASYSAIDYIVGWDFVKAGNVGRAADFAAADNDAVSLVMRNDAGDEQGWLDKSQANGGYEGRPAAVNWRTGASNGDVGYYYWQTSFNASAFTDIKVMTAMAYNYNAYQRQLVEYSLDGENWKSVGAINIDGVKNWTDVTFSLPAEVNNQSKVYLRWKSDKTSSVDGTASKNDGIALGATYIIGTQKLVDDGTAPVLVSSVPADKSTGASANGKVVLTFDEKVKLTTNAKATIGSMEVTPVVSGKTVICEYKGLDYSSDYKFILYAGSVSDLTDNTIAKDIVVNFQTKVKPAVTKGAYDFVVPDDGTITEALAAANKRGASATDRFRIFIKNGTYVFDCNGTTTGGDGKTYDDPRSYLQAPYVSFIGESMEGVIITNKTPDATWDNGYGAACPLEGIGKGDVLIIQKDGHDAYFQNLTIKTSMGDSHGRDIALNDQSNRTVFKDARLWGYQDTYVSNSDAGKFYFEGGVIRGRTDYLCGKGDVFYNEVTLQQCGGGGYLAVPSKPKKYGYVFNNCYIKKETKDVTFYLGRPWGKGTPTASFINTKMDAAPVGEGWAEMSGGWPARFAEYNSFLTSGTQLDLSGRKKLFGAYKDADKVEHPATHPNDPVLTLDEAKTLTIHNVMGQDDDWDPTALTEQASAPANVKLAGTTLSWDNSDYVLLWAVCKNGKVTAFTTEPSYTVDDATAQWSVRAANEMGGLSEAAPVATGISNVAAESSVKSVRFFNMKGMQVSADCQGVIMKVTTYDNGTTTTEKINNK